MYSTTNTGLRSGRRRLRCSRLSEVRAGLVRPLRPAVTEQQVFLGDGVDRGAVSPILEQLLAVLRHHQEARLERALAQEQDNGSPGQRALKPGFLVVPQNGEELLEDAGYRATIDAIAKEDLLFGDGRPKRPNKPARTSDSLEHLNRLRPDRKPVFVVEYIDDPDDVALARKRIEELGFVPHFADRKLDTMRPADLPPAKK